MGTPPNELPPPPPEPHAQSASQTQIAGQQTAPSTAVPMASGTAMTVAPGQTNTLAVVSLVTAIVAPLGHVIGLGGITLIIISIVTGHMARREIKQTGERGANIALAGLIISYIHAAATILGIIFLFGIIVAFLAAFFHAASGGR